MSEPTDKPAERLPLTGQLAGDLALKPEHLGQILDWRNLPFWLKASVVVLSVTWSVILVLVFPIVRWAALELYELQRPAARPAPSAAPPLPVRSPAPSPRP